MLTLNCDVHFLEKSVFLSLENIENAVSPRTYALIYLFNVI